LPKHLKMATVQRKLLFPDSGRSATDSPPAPDSVSAPPGTGVSARSLYDQDQATESKAVWGLVRRPGGLPAHAGVAAAAAARSGDVLPSAGLRGPRAALDARRR